MTDGIAINLDAVAPPFGECRQLIYERPMTAWTPGDNFLIDLR